MRSWIAGTRQTCGANSENRPGTPRCFMSVENASDPSVPLKCLLVFHLQFCEVSKQLISGGDSLV